jgi:hypothetical protein
MCSCFAIQIKNHPILSLYGCIDITLLLSLHFRSMKILDGFNHLVYIRNILLPSYVQFHVWYRGKDNA